MNTRYDNMLLVAKCIKRVSFLSGPACSYNDYRHKMIMNELKPILSSVESNLPIFSEGGKSSISNTIWVFWWQGENDAPLMVKSCISSIRKNSEHFVVRVIDKNNLSDYLSLSDDLFDKVSTGKISLTHLSDIVRFALLSRYGGVWMDATLYVTAPLEMKIPKQGVFTCGGYSDLTHFNVALGRWTGFFLGTVRGGELARFVAACFKRYWEKNDQLIDYFLIDYILAYAYERNIGLFADSCSAAKGLQPGLFDLQPLLNKPFDKRKWMQLTSRTSVFKLSYKHTPSQVKGTFFECILDNSLAEYTSAYSDS